MPKIFEIFGHPLNDNSQQAINDRAAARCPFMGKDCDGGGNRHMANITLANHPELQALYPNRQTLHAGVCSIQPNENVGPWIVCPNRLLALGQEEAGMRAYQQFSEEECIKLFGYPNGTKLGVWKEVRLTYTPPIAEKIEDETTDEDEAEDLSVVYRFDYIVMPVGRIRGSELESYFDMNRRQLQRLITKSGYEMTIDGDEYFIEDFPYGTPNIIEIMTSSTSGGNKEKRTQISMAFEDAILGKPHKSPGINYRQVWARMASQLIAKSEIAIAWGGKTVWVVQDVLAEYISQTTALDIRKFKATELSEVNILAFSYGDTYVNPAGILDLNKFALFSGVISNSRDDAPTFSDIVRLPVQPPVEILIELLAKKGRASNYINV